MVEPRNFLGTRAQPIDNTGGTVSFYASSTSSDSPLGFAQVATVTLHAIGEEDATSHVGIEVDQLLAGNPIESFPMSAWAEGVLVTVSTGLCGDVNKNERVDIGDAMFIAQYLVGSRDSATLDLNLADVNVNERVDIGTPCSLPSIWWGPGPASAWARPGSCVLRDHPFILAVLNKVHLMATSIARRLCRDIFTALLVLAVMPVFPAWAGAGFSRHEMDQLQANLLTRGATFSIGPNPATDFEISDLCGLKPPENWWVQAKAADTGLRDGTTLPASFNWCGQGCVPPSETRDSAAPAGHLPRFFRWKVTFLWREEGSKIFRSSTWYPVTVMPWGAAEGGGPTIITNGNIMIPIPKPALF